MLFIYFEITGARSGNMFRIILNAISSNIVEFKHNRIIIKELKERSELFKNFPDELFFHEYDDNSENNTIIKNNFFNDKNVNKLLLSEKQDIIDRYVKPFIDYNFQNNFDIDF